MELPMNSLVELFKLASLGKAIGGLIHNINGPLQNIGLDLEMAQYTLENNTEECDKNMNLLARLRRIEDELERLNDMIKTSSNKATQVENDSFLNMNDFIEQELSFLNTNLYFKHNVSTKLELTDNPPLTCNVAKNTLLALGWLLQIIIEDIEENKLTVLNIKTTLKDDILNFEISTEDGILSEEISSDLLGKNTSGLENFTITDNGVGLILVLMIFERCGIILDYDTADSSSIINLKIPLTN